MFFDYDAVDKAIRRCGKVRLSDLSKDQIEAGKEYLSSLDLSEVVYDRAPKAFDGLQDSMDLVWYLSSKRKISELSEQYVSHYTRFDVAKKIVSGKYLYLCNPSNMNDGLEFNSPSMDCSKLYFTSFSLESNENMGMWSMYGQPWEEGVKISIPKKLFLKWKDKVDEVYFIDSKTNAIQNKNPLSNDLFKCSITRVAYFEQSYSGEVKQIRCGENANNTLIKSVDSPLLAGYVKDLAWSYEKEIRFRIDTRMKYKENKIAVKVPDEIIKNMVITTSPRFKKKITKNDLSEVAEVKNSIFAGKLNYIYCDVCRKNYNKNSKKN